ncbi:hypothetical protein RRG08_014004 [Elysia crispata]|uniref:Uncharacterized protein n=1 Tax=Elysia crispata TaxID=231223 RepID=A0AAE1E8A4_9GAST|nr:hypothetical protein RRG08_014004 [Elysia crispata]
MEKEIKKRPRSCLKKTRLGRTYHPPNFPLFLAYKKWPAYDSREPDLMEHNLPKRQVQRPCAARSAPPQKWTEEPSKTEEKEGGEDESLVSSTLALNLVQDKKT